MEGGIAGPLKESSVGEVSILSSSRPWVRHRSPRRLPGHSRSYIAKRESHSVSFLNPPYAALREVAGKSY